MRLHCRHDRAWLCPIGLVVASGGTVELVAIDENAAERRNAALTRRRSILAGLSVVKDFETSSSAN
jgi:hypothetical protein